MLSELVVPGQRITSEPGFLRGHGCYLEETDENQILVASTAGIIERVNKLITVRPVKSRYIGEVGDLVVGRITAVASKKWKVDVCSIRDGNLQLSSVNLPFGAQRIRTHEDQLQMRRLFTENDLISAEIQNINSDGIISLHTRSLKYGKLENGQLIVVPSSLIKRLPQHYFSLPCGVDVLLGKNGYIWIQRSIPPEWHVEVAVAAVARERGAKQTTGDVEKEAGSYSAMATEAMIQAEDVPQAEILELLRAKHRETALLSDERQRLARVANAIRALSSRRLNISPEAISSVYERSVALQLQPKQMIQPSALLDLTTHLMRG